MNDRAKKWKVGGKGEEKDNMVRGRERGNKRDRVWGRQGRKKREGDGKIENIKANGEKTSTFPL